MIELFFRFTIEGIVLPNVVTYPCNVQRTATESCKPGKPILHREPPFFEKSWLLDGRF
jgi:hypothetical protein